MAGPPHKPVALITAFSDVVLQRILDTIAAGPRPPAADWVVGTFGVNKAAAERVTAVRGCQYAPVFGIQPATSMPTRLKRRLPKEAASRVGDAAHAGEIPGSSERQVIPPRDRRVWGIELGRRFRDELRANRTRSFPIELWQFDEVLGQCGQAGSSNRHREFVGGVLHGLAEGRPELNDRPQKGFVWVARTAVMAAGLPGLPFSGDLPPFWQDLDRATLFLVGEEYPPFTGSPSSASQLFSDGHRALGRKTGVRRSLGDRYVVGMTPGWRLVPGLGGNVGGKSPADLTAWRNGFIDARIGARRPAGFAQFNFVVENARPNRVEDAVRSLHHASRQLAS
jgi:hypothetical protein